MVIDREVFATPHVSVGAFRCPVHHPSFRYTGPTEHYIAAFPRTGVWIRHAGSRAFVADPGVVTIYNAGQEYTREPMHPEGDRCDWFGLSEEMAHDVARAADPRAPHDSTRPFRFQHAHSDSQLYFRQRLLFDRLIAGACDAFEAEEEVLSIVHRVLQLASSEPRAPGKLTDAHRDLAEHARAELVRDATTALTLGGLAARLDVSPWHLCRVFRAATGTSLHAFRLDLRLRMALERLENPAADISRMAHELGFSSHSHFTAAMRGRLGCTPSGFRSAVAGRRGSKEVEVGRSGSKCVHSSTLFDRLRHPST